MRKNVIFFGIIALLFAGYVIVTNSQQKDTVPAKPTLSNQQLLNGMAGKLEIKPRIQEYRYFDWIDENDVRLPLIGQSFLVGTVDTNGIGKYTKLREISQVTLDAFKPIQQTTTGYLTSVGFSENAKNTRTAGLAPAQSVFMGYENGTAKCLVRLDVQTDPFGNFFCGTVDQEQMEKQQEFKSMVDKLIQEEGPLSFRVDKIEENFALGSAVGDYSGYTWMAKKTGENWEVIWRGNEIALCSDMTRLGIPKSIYGDCYQED